jgi:hypothetical protein
MDGKDDANENLIAQKILPFKGVPEAWKFGCRARPAREC